ncbi:profilin [Streptomyces sp. NPDC005775]|uniref:profilin n=1 Tax=Streptomyces sp. NPDC005775 TaxID=3364729 RepID=UPI0036C5B7B6
MSWQTYVDEHLVKSGACTAGAIIGFDGTTWAQSAGFALKVGEGQAIVALFQNPADVFPRGVTVAGVKYMGVKGEERSIHGKKGATGVGLGKTNQCIVIGYYNETRQPGNAAVAVQSLTDHLLANGQ